jgi:HlyD family secretion protein
MPAEVYVETGERSLMSYITKPLRDQFVRAFRDN